MLILVCVAAVVQFRRNARPVPLLASVVIDLPDDWHILNESPAISPDSRHIVFSAFYGRAGRRAIWDRPLDASAARMLADTQDGTEPFWSPDAKSIGFFAEGKLKILQLAGGPARVVCDAPRTPAEHGSRRMSCCSRLGRPGPSPRSASSAGRSDKSPRSIARRASAGTRNRSRCPMDATLFTCRIARTSSSPRSHRKTERASRRSAPLQSHVEATASGQVLFVRDGSLLAQPLDIARGRSDRRCHGAGGRPHAAGEVLRWQVLDVALNCSST